MQDLFQTRLAKQWQRYFKLGRYVFNDHAILALLIALGGGALAYRQLWITAPINWLTQSVLAVIILLTLLVNRRPANFLLPADPLYRLANETELRILRKKATYYSFVVAFVIEIILLLILWPMMLRLYTTNLTLIIGGTLIVAVIKVLLLQMRIKHEGQWQGQTYGDLANWKALVVAEENRRSQINSFFNAFIDVPGLKKQIKQRKWLEKIVRVNRGDIEQLAFLRRPEFLSAWLTVTFLGMFIAATTAGWLRVLLLILMVYMIVIQFLPLAQVHEQIVFKHLYPISNDEWDQKYVKTTAPWIGATGVLFFVTALLAGRGMTLIELIGFVIITAYLMVIYPKTMLKNRRKKHAFKK
ncbi:MAG: ABC transporter permease [Lactobacillaceae bacterium]|jgi:ABC-2 type transport system permease protein|nr:ABC transporter permease [Lactobacillaceae bacterium]